MTTHKYRSKYLHLLLIAAYDDFAQKIVKLFSLLEVIIQVVVFYITEEQLTLR